MGWKRAMALLVALLATSLLFSHAGANNFGSRVRWINDYHDRAVYADRGSWFALSKRPYLDIPSEYPQVATYAFAAPDMLTTLVFPQRISQDRLRKREWANPPNTFINHPVPDHQYAEVFSLLMMICLWGSVCLLAALCDTWKATALLLLLPGTFYFAFNRFDILPCVLTLLSLYWFLGRRELLAAAVLAVATMTKWYAALLLPVFWAYDRSTGRGRRWPLLFVFAAVCGLLLVPTFLAGGLDGILVPYQFHKDVGTKRESLLYLLNHYSWKLFDHPVATTATYLGFFLLQFSIVPFSATAAIRSKAQVVKWSALSLLVFVLFTKFNSPQWMLWYIPFLILDAGSPAAVLALIGFDLLIYLRFPLLHDAIGSRSRVFTLSTIVYVAALIGFSVHLLRELLPNHPLLLRLRRIRPKAVPAP